MKIKIFIIFSILSCFIYGQDEFSKLSVIQSPGSYDDGFSFALQYEHQNKTVYYGPEIYYFPNLNDLTYTHLIGRFGFNIFVDKWNVIRLYSGVRGGALHRDSEGIHALMGLEAGFDIFIGNFFIGAGFASDNKTDSKIWSNEDYHTINSGLIRLGIKF